MNITPTKIFQYSSGSKIKQDSIKKTEYWLKKLYNQDQQTTRNNIDIAERMSAMELKMDGNDVLNHDNVTDKSPETKGREQEATNHARKAETGRHMVEDLVRQSNRRIICISSTFPWSIFPNTIDVEESRVAFNFRQFMSYQSYNVDIKDISNIFIESGLFFATLHVVSRTFIHNNVKIGYLRKKQAVQVRRVIEGLRTFAYNNIDTSHYEINELISKLEELHVTDHVKYHNMAM